MCAAIPLSIYRIYLFNETQSRVQSCSLAHLHMKSCTCVSFRTAFPFHRTAIYYLIFFELFSARAYEYLPTVRDLLINERDGI